jgi:hypothetical protein
MPNHQLRSLELLDEVDDLQQELAEAYASKSPGHVVADLHQRINLTLKKADIHATHALRQAVEDRVRA